MKKDKCVICNQIITNNYRTVCWNCATKFAKKYLKS